MSKCIVWCDALCFYNSQPPRKFPFSTCYICFINFCDLIISWLFDSCPVTKSAFYIRCCLWLSMNGFEEEKFLVLFEASINVLVWNFLLQKNSTKMDYSRKVLHGTHKQRFCWELTRNYMCSIDPVKNIVSYYRVTYWYMYKFMNIVATYLKEKGVSFFCHLKFFF